MQICTQKEVNIKRNKIIKWTICSSFVTALVGAAVWIVVIKLKDDNYKPRTNNLEYKVKIEGAVNKPGEYYFKNPLSIREIIFNAEVKTNADIESLQLEKIINEDFELLVPFKIIEMKKIKWIDLTEIEQLTSLGISKNVALKVLNFRRQNNEATWEQILELKGIGKVTLNQLKELIDLS